MHSRVDASLRMGCSNQEGLLTLKTSPSVQPCACGGGRRLAAPCIRSACGRFTMRAPLHVRAYAPPCNHPTPSHQLDGTCCFRVSFAAAQVAMQPTNRPTRLMVMRAGCGKEGLRGGRDTRRLSRIGKQGGRAGWGRSGTDGGQR